RGVEPVSTPLQGGAMHHPVPLVFVLVAALVAAAAAAASTPQRVAETAKNAKLRETILVTTTGRTLYALSAERHGRFVCVKSCLSFWTPLTLRAGRAPAGVTGLGTIVRPDGRHQVTFRGAPLYTFSGDHRRGDANGEGFK